MEKVRSFFHPPPQIKLSQPQNSLLLEHQNFSTSIPLPLQARDFCCCYGGIVGYFTDLVLYPLDARSNTRPSVAMIKNVFIHGQMYPGKQKHSQVSTNVLGWQKFVFHHCLISVTFDVMKRSPKLIKINHLESFPQSCVPITKAFA